MDNARSRLGVDDQRQRDELMGPHEVARLPNADEALEMEVDMLKRAIATTYRDSQRKRDGFIAWCQGAGHVDALLGFLHFYPTEKT